MKNIFFVCTLLLSIALFSCSKNSRIEEPLPCKDFGYSCEFQKDYQLLKVLDFINNPVDCFGRDLQKNYWYLHSEKALTLIPLSRERMSFEGYERMPRDGEFFGDSIGIDTTGLMHGGAELEVLVLSFGEKSAHLSFNTSGMATTVIR